MSSEKIAWICFCAACLVVAWQSCEAAPAADEKSDVAKNDKPLHLPVVAIIPPISRGNPQYATLSPAITTMLSSIIEQSGRAIVVDRTNVAKVFSEKDLAELGLTDREALAKKGQLIGADYAVFGYYDARDDMVQFMIRSAKIADWLQQVRKGDSIRFAVEREGKSPGDRIVQTVEDVASAICNKLPETPSSRPLSPRVSSLAKGRSVAVFSLVVCPQHGPTERMAGLLADLLATDIQKIMSVRLVEREKLEHILAEKKLQFAGLATQGQAILAARLLGADYLLTGGIVQAGKPLRVDLQLLDVVTGAVVATASTKTTADKLLKTHQDLAQALSQRIGLGLYRLLQLGPSPADSRIAEAEIQADWAENLLRYCRERDASFVTQVRSLVRVALDLAPEDGLVNKSAGVAAWNLLQPRTEAEQYLRKGVERGPDIAECHINYGAFLLYTWGDPKKALVHARQAVKILGLKPETFLETDSLRARSLIALCLLANGQLQEAETWAMTTASRDSSQATVDTAVAILKAQSKFKEAADLLTKKGSPTAAEIMRQAEKGPLDLRKQLGLLIRRSQIDAKARLMLARDSKQSNPELAAAICWRIIQHDRWKEDKPRPPSNPNGVYSRGEVYDYWISHPKVDDADVTAARAILKELGQTLETPLATGPVFDLEALRRAGIKFALLKYEMFPYEQQLPYLKAYLEDIFGVPIVVNEGFRPMPKTALNDVQGFLEMKEALALDLMQGKSELKCVGVTGLMGLPVSIESQETHDLTLSWTTGRAVVSTTQCASRTPATHAAKTSIVGNLLRNLSYCVATRIRPDTVLQAMEASCPVQACVVTKWGVRDYELVPCMVCRQELYGIHPDWAKGPPQREAIVAGPAKSALANGKATGKVLLVPMDISAEDAHLGAVAQCLSTSLGLDCQIHSRIDRGDNIPAIPRSLAEIAPELDGVDKHFAAVCILTGKRFCERPWNEMLVGESVVLSPRRWRVWIPELDEPGPKTRCPLIILSVADKRDFNLPTCYRRVETLNLDKDGKKVAVASPAYSKLLIGALAIVARTDHECWTLGCPTTVWETIGVPHRCSHYLCPGCRKAVAAYYSAQRK